MAVTTEGQYQPTLPLKLKFTLDRACENQCSLHQLFGLELLLPAATDQLKLK